MTTNGKRARKQTGGNRWTLKTAYMRADKAPSPEKKKRWADMQRERAKGRAYTAIKS